MTKILETPIDLALREEIRKSIWNLMQKAPTSATGKAIAETEPTSPNEQSSSQAEKIAVDARELVEAKLLKQLSEMTQLLEQQTTILYAQQKLLEDLTGHQNRPKKRKPGMAKKIKNLVHKGKIIWSVL